MPDIIRSMLRLHPESKPSPLTHSLVAHEAVRTICLAQAMGLIPSGKIIDLLHPDAFSEMLAKIIKNTGIGKSAMGDLHNFAAWEPEKAASILKQFNRNLTDSPLPSTEWPGLEKVLGVDLLTRLLGISPASLHRYRSGFRRTPDRIAARLHFLALVAGDLTGSYNEFGIRRWFGRSRYLLYNKSPEKALTGDWDPEDPLPRRIQELAHSLIGSPAT